MMLVTTGKVFGLEVFFKVAYNIFCIRYSYSLVFAKDMYGKINIFE